MADDSRKVPKAGTVLESDRAAFYAWAGKQGLTRIHHPSDELTEELWLDRAGVMKSAGRIVSEHPNWRQSEPETMAAPPRKLAMWFPSSQESRRWLRLFPTVALVIIIVGAFLRATDSRETTAAFSRETAQSSPGDGGGLGLTVTTRSNQLEIRWNKGSAAIKDSAAGVLKITDEGITEALPFDQAGAHDEYIAYTPKTNDVSIRLEVTGKDGRTVSESVRSVTIP